MEGLFSSDSEHKCTAIKPSQERLHPLGRISAIKYCFTAANFLRLWKKYCATLAHHSLC